MNKELETLINNLEGCIGMFDYMLTPIENNLLLSYINELQQENNQLKLDFELYKDNHIYKNYEVERKDIVIKELRSWLEEQYLRSDDYSDYETVFKMVSNKLNELTGEEK